MAPTSESQKDEIIKYLLLVMKNTDSKPDYHKVAQESGLSCANTAQKRFKKFVELGGFALVGGAVIESDAAHATPAKPKARGKKSTATPISAKKRKVRVMTPCEEDEKEDVKH